MKNFCENLPPPRSMTNFGPPIHVPEDITRSILLHLPVKSLLRFRTVCKSWRNLILSDQFKQIYYASNYVNRRREVVFFSEESTYNEDEFPILDQEILESAEANRLMGMTLGSETMKLEKYYRVVGHCNGIICLSRAYNKLRPPTILLWNPALRQCRALPSSTIDFFCNTIYSVGFGYDPTTQDYKVVRASAGLFRIEMYSLNNNSWKKIPCFKRQFINYSNSGLCFEGRLYWIMQDATSEGIGTILVFDLAKERFSKFDLPETVVGTRDQGLGHDLGLFRGRVSLLKIRLECEIWSMQDHCMPESWMKVCTIPVDKFSLHYEYLGPLGFSACWVKSSSVALTADGRVIAALCDRPVRDPYPDREHFTECALLYDVESGTLKVHREATRYRYNWFSMTGYVETFVSVMPKCPEEWCRKNVDVLLLVWRAVIYAVLRRECCGPSRVHRFPRKRVSVLLSRLFLSLVVISTVFVYWTSKKNIEG